MNPQVKSTLNKIRWMFLPKAQKGINQIRRDDQAYYARGKYPNLSRFFDNNNKVRGLPMPVKTGGGNGNVTLKKQWQEFFNSNNSDAAKIYTYGKDGKKLNSGWVNTQPWPRVRQVVWGGAYVVVTRIEGNKAYIESYSNAKFPKDYTKDYLQQFSVVYTDDTYGLPDCGKCLTFVISNPGEELWMDVKDLTFIRKV